VRQIQRKFAAAISVGLILLLAGCATPVNVVKTFDDPGYADSAFSDVLVLGGISR